MLKPLIRTLNGWRFELPLALVLGASVAFALIAMPYSPFAGIPMIAAHGLVRPLEWLSAALAAIVSGVLAYRAMRYPVRVGATVSLAESVEEAEAPPIDVAVRLRRSDAHPDFPPREPIRASRDLGEPFMDVAGFDSGTDAPVCGAGLHVFDAEYVELPADAPEAIENAIDAPEHVPVPEEQPTVGDADGSDGEAADTGDAALRTPPAQPPLSLVEDADEHPTIAAFTPEPAIEPAPQPERARRESLSEMMERLSAGLERRAGKPVSPPPSDMLAEMLARPRAATPELRDALDELNRLAGRRG